MYQEHWLCEETERGKQRKKEFFLTGILHSWLKISMVCALFQNYQHLFEKNDNNNASFNKLSNKLQHGIEILVGQAVFKLWIKTVKMLFGSITQEPLG